MTCYNPKIKTMGFPARNLIIADLLDRIAEGKDCRAGLPSDRNRDTPASYAKSPATCRTEAVPGTPLDPLSYSTGGQSDDGFDSRETARTGDAIGSDGARVLRKGRLGGERGDLIASGLDE